MKFQPSAIAATNLSGKSGGTVATITNTFRRKSNPRQPNTSYQTAIRSRFTTYSTNWGTLAEENQDAWIAAAPNFVFFKNGEAYTLKGNTLYQKINNNLARAGQSTIDLPPLPAAFPNFILTDLLVYQDDIPVDPMGVLITMNIISIPDGFTPILIGTPQMPPGRRSFQNRFVEMPGIIEYGDYQMVGDVGYNARFPPAEIGSRVGIGAYLINNTTGQASQPQYLQTIVVST